MFRKLMLNQIERFPILAQFLRHTRIFFRRSSPFIHTQWGFSLAGDRLMAEGHFEQIETNIVRELLKEMDIFINVGANIGYYCCHALSLEKKVIAIEPIPENVHFLLRNITINDWTKDIDVYPLALGETRDVLSMYGGRTGASLIKGWASAPDSYLTRVPVLTLDRVVCDQIKDKRALILVDIEGAEFMMLKGALKTLNNNPRPIWIVEISSTEHQPYGRKMNPNLEQTFELFFQNGYKAYAVDTNQLITLDLVKQVLREESKFSTHNFIFKHDS